MTTIPVPLQPVDSTNLKAVGYHEPTMVLYIQFKNGSVYQYSGVPANVMPDMLAHDSAGRYFSQMVKNTYPFTKVA